MRVLVTGGAGFVGSHLCERLLIEGHEVYCLDDFSTGTMGNVDSMVDSPRFTMLPGSAGVHSVVDGVVQAVDFVYHLAAKLGVRRAVNAPVEVLQDNLQATDVVLGCCAGHHKPVLIASTSEVYGPSLTPQHHEDDPLVVARADQTRWSYAAAKIADECLAWAHHRENDLNVVVTRLFNAVGPRQRADLGMVLPGFVEAALSGEPLTVHGDGKQMRCFTWVGDTVEALIRLMHPGCWNRAYNVGSKNEYTVLGLARRVIKAADSKSEIRHVPHQEVFGAPFKDMLRRVPDQARLSVATGYVPSTPMSQILKWTVADARR